MFGSLGWGEILPIVLIILLLFGARRIPEIMKSFAQGLQEFRKVSHGATEDIQKAVKDATDDVTKTPPA